MAAQPRKGGQESSQGAPGLGAKTEGCSQGVSGKPCESHHGDKDRACSQKATTTRSTTIRPGRGPGRVLSQPAQARSPSDQATSPFRSCTNTCTCVPGRHPPSHCPAPGDRQARSQVSSSGPEARPGPGIAATTDPLSIHPEGPVRRRTNCTFAFQATDCPQSQ